MTNITSRAAGIVFIEDQRDVVLVGPGQDAVAKFGDLHAFAHDDGVLADQVDTRDVAVEVDAHTGPVQPGGDLFDVGGLAGAVIAGDHDAAVAGEPGEDRKRRGAIEQVVRIDLRNVLAGLGIGRHFQIALYPEDLGNPKSSCRAFRRLSLSGPSSVLHMPVFCGLGSKSIVRGSRPAQAGNRACQARAPFDRRTFRQVPLSQGPRPSDPARSRPVVRAAFGAG